MKDIRLPRYKELVDWALEWNYGDIISHEEIADIMQTKAGTSEYYSNVGKANKQLLVSGKMLMNIYEKGYQVLHPDEYTKASAQAVDQGKRKIVQGIARAKYAPISQMSESAKEKHIAYSDRLSSFGALIQQGTVELKILAASEKKPVLKLNEG